MIPYVGIVAGVVDAVLYFQEGNYMEGLLCIAGACIGAGGAIAAVGAAKGVCAVTTAGMALKTAGTAFTATVMMQYTIEGAEKTLDIMAANGGKMNREAWMSAAQTAMCGMGAVAGFMAVGSCIDEMASLSARGLACFVAGTKVLTDEGLKNIEDIQAGDYVYSTNEETGESGYKEVVNTFAKDTEVLTHVEYELEFESCSYSLSKHKENYIDKENIHCNDRGEDGYNNRGNSEQQESTTKYSHEIVTTMNHRFWCEGEWKSAGTLEEGDILTLADGSEAIVTEVTFEETHTTVYNMEVADYHTYYVGEDSVWVHNNVSCKTPTGAVIEDGALSGPSEFEIQEVTPGFDNWLNKGETNNKVYFGMEGDKATYVGITRQSKEARLAQHNSSKNKYKKDFTDLEVQYDNLTRNQARAIEQYYIELKNGSNIHNRISSIGINNKYHDEAIKWAKKFLGV